MPKLYLTLRARALRLRDGGRGMAGEKMAIADPAMTP